MTAENEREGREGLEYNPAISEIGNRIRYIQRTLGEIENRLDDHYRMLHEIYDATVTGNGADWEDLYDLEMDGE